MILNLLTQLLQMHGGDFRQTCCQRPTCLLNLKVITETGVSLYGCCFAENSKQTCHLDVFLIASFMQLILDCLTSLCRQQAPSSIELN